MLGMASEGDSVGGESWFALKKDEFYVILDSVLTEMTQCDERNSVSGCIELIKLLSDNGTTSAINDKHSTCDVSGNTKPADDLNPNKSGNDISGCIGKSEIGKGGKPPNRHKPPVNCRTSNGRRFSYNAQLDISSSVDCRRHLNKGNLQSATCAAKRRGHRDRAASRPGVVFSKEAAASCERKSILSAKTRDVKASLFHPNRNGASHGFQNIYVNSKTSSDQNGFNSKQSMSSASRHQRALGKIHEIRLLHNRSRTLCSGLHHDTRVSSNRPSSEYRRHQSSHWQTNPGLCSKIKAHSFDRNTADIRHTSASKATEDQRSCSEDRRSFSEEQRSFSEDQRSFSEDQRSCSEINSLDRHITELELRSLTPFELSSAVYRKFLGPIPKAPNSKWAPVDKTVINNILDDILSSDDSHSPMQTDLQASRDSHDFDTHNGDVDKTADGFVLQNDVKVEHQSDVTMDDTKTGSLGNNGVIANVKLVDVRRFDVSQMSFKWKSQLLWRMRHDKVSQTSLSSLCLT